MIRIPRQNRDLKRYVILRDIRRALLYLLWLAVWLGGALSYNDNHQTYPDHRRMVGWRLWLWMLIAAATGFLLLRIWRFFTDRTFTGTIVQTGLSRTYTASDDPAAAGDTAYDFRLNTTLRAETDNGKKKRLRFEQKRGFYHYYYEGRRIVHFHGLTYPINLDPDARDGYVCAACGAWSEDFKSHCDICRHTMIDPKNLSL